MNKELEALEKIKEEFGCDPAYYGLNLEFEILQQALEMLVILKKGYFSTAYNPAGDYYHITFDIYGEKDYKSINEFLKRSDRK